MSQAGPVAVGLAARRPDLVRRLVFVGTYAGAANVFANAELNASLVAMVRSHWGIGSKLFADLFRPDVTDAAADHLAAVLRDSADRDVAAGYLAPSTTSRHAASGHTHVVVHYGVTDVPYHGALAGPARGTGWSHSRGGTTCPGARGPDRVVGPLQRFWLTGG
jgi:pimeloyl-ACP methyl ester carboxylesterase